MQRFTATLREFFTSLRGFDWSELRYPSASGQWPFAVRALICAGSVVSMLLAASVVLVPDLHAHWQASQNIASGLADEHLVLTARHDTVAARNLSMASQRVWHAYLHRQLLPAEPMPMVLDRLREAAEMHGVAVSALRPENNGHHAFGQVFEIDFKFQANKQQLSALLDYIGALPLALAIRQADWQVASSRVHLTLLLLVAADSGKGDLDGVAPDVRNTPGRPDAAVGWQRVAFIQRGDRYLEVQRNPRGATRRRVGELLEVQQ